MKILTATLVLFFLVTPILAQEKFAEYRLSPQQLVTRDVKLLTDDNGNLLADIGCFAGNTRVFFQEAEAAKIIYQDSTADNKKDDAATYVIKNLQKIRSLQRLATVSDHGIYNDCYYSGKKKAIFFVKINAATGYAAVTDTINLGAHEHIITVLEDSGAIYMLSYLEKSDIIYINIKKPGSQIQTIEKKIELSEHDLRVKKGIPFFSEFFTDQKEESYLVYDTRRPNPSYLSAVKEKVYHFPGKLIFSFENNDLQTNLVTLSLRDFTHNYYKVQSPVEPTGESSLGQTSSFLSNDILFKTGSYGNLFFIRAANIYTGEVYCNTIINTSKAGSIENAPFFSGAIYNETAAGKKRSLGKYLAISAIGVIPAGGNLFEIEISSLYQGMSWGLVLLNITLSTAGTYFINSIPDMVGFSLFSFKQKNTLSIRNTLDIGTGKFVNNDTASLLIENWNKKIAAVNKFIERYEYAEDKATAIIAAKTVYVYFIEPSEEKLVVYKF